MDANAQRREVRRQLAEQRRALTPAQRIAGAQGLRRSLEQLPEYLTDARVAGYWACNGELPLNLIIPPLATRGQEFLLPVIGPAMRCASRRGRQARTSRPTATAFLNRARRANCWNPSSSTWCWCP